MKGSIRFDNDINIEVDVDKSAEEGAKLTSAVNLVDGQELGGADNYKEVITGTAAAPFGDYSAADLATALFNNDIHADISLDGSALGVTTEIKLPIFCYEEQPEHLSASGVSFTFSSEWVPYAIYQATSLGWNLDGSLKFAVMYAGGTLTDISAYGSVIPTVLTIYHHPMPEE